MCCSAARRPTPEVRSRLRLACPGSAPARAHQDPRARCLAGTGTAEGGPSRAVCGRSLLVPAEDLKGRRGRARDRGQRSRSLARPARAWAGGWAHVTAGFLAPSAITHTQAYCTPRPSQGPRDIWEDDTCASHSCFSGWERRAEVPAGRAGSSAAAELAARVSWSPGGATRALLGNKCPRNVLSAGQGY